MKMTRMPMLPEAARAVLVTGIYLTLGPAVQGQPPTRGEPVVDIFLRVDGIEGEATDSGRAGWIDVDSFNYSIARPVGTGETATGQGLTLVKNVDKASPFLYLHCSSGRPLEKMVLEITQTADDDVTIQEFRLHNVTVTSVQASARSGVKRATERLTLRYESIAWTYVRVDPITGSVISEVTMQWNLTDGGDS